jgi:hypothetical protein
MEEPKILIVTIIGGTGALGDTADRDTKFSELLGRKLAHVKSPVLLRTGGVGGFPMYVTDAFLDEKEAMGSKETGSVVHILPLSYTNTKGIRGKVIHEGKDMEERRTILVKKTAHVV